MRELPIDQIATVEAEIAHVPWMRCGRQHGRTGFAGLDEGPVGEQAVFVSVAEQQFAQRDEIGEIPVGFAARIAHPLPVEARLRDAIDKTEGLKPTHVVGRQNLDRTEAGGLRGGFLLSSERFDPRRIGHKDEQHVRRALADAPEPIRRRVGADIAQAPRAVVVARHALDEFRGETPDDVFADSQSAEALCGEGDLYGLLDALAGAARRDVRQARRRQRAQPRAALGRVGDAQQQIARAVQRVES